MTIQNVRIIPLKKEYIESLEGQDLLTKIVDKNVECSDMAEFEEGSYAVSDVALVADEISEESEEKAWVTTLFLGADDFQYPYTRWEIEMNMKNPTKEQIAEYIVKNWYYPIDPDDTEEIESIAQGEEFSFHDVILLRSVSAECAKELAVGFDKQKLIAAMKQLEVKLNQIGIYVDDLDDDANNQVLDALNDIYQKAAAEGIGVLYIIEVW